MERKLAFTKRLLETLPLPEPGQRLTYHDSKTPGLGLRVTANGSKTFIVRRRLADGQAERVTLGTLGQVPPPGSGHCGSN